MVVAIAQMLVLLNMTTTIASLCDNGECSNKRDRKLEDHFVCVLLSLFPVRCVLPSMRKMPFDRYGLPCFLFFSIDDICGRQGVSDLFGPQIVKAKEREAKSIRCNE